MSTHKHFNSVFDSYPLKAKVLSPHLLNMRGHHNSNDHSEGAEEAEKLVVRADAQMLRAASPGP